MGIGFLYHESIGNLSHCDVVGGKTVIIVKNGYFSVFIVLVSPFTFLPAGIKNVFNNQIVVR